MLRQILIQTPPFAVIDHPKFIVPSCILGVGFDERGALGVFRRTFDPNLPADSDTIELEFLGVDEEMDIITLWRAMLILQNVKVPEEKDLISAYYAAQRFLEPDEVEMAELAISKIGKGVHSEIMNIALPHELVDHFYKLIAAGHKVNLGTMSKEVEAGNIAWTEELSDAGVMHPDVIKDKKEREAKIVAGYKNEFRDYAFFMNISLDSREISALEEKLVEVVYRGVESLYGRDIAFGLAYILKETEDALFMAERLEKSGLSNHYLERITRSAINLGALLLTGIFRKWFLISWPIRKKEEYIRILTKLNQAYVNGDPITGLMEKN